MVSISPKTTHAKRLSSAAFASCAAVVVLIFAFSEQHRHKDHSDQDRQNASSLLGGYGGSGRHGSNVGAGGLADGGGSHERLLQLLTGGPLVAPHSDDAGDGHDDHDSGLRPNGENGLLILSDYADGFGEGNGQGAGGGAFSPLGGQPGGSEGGPAGFQGGVGPSGGFGGGGGGPPAPGGGSPGQPNTGGPGGGSPGQPNVGGPGGDDACLLSSALDCIDSPNGGGGPPGSPGGSSPPNPFQGFSPPTGDGPNGDNPPLTDLTVTTSIPEPAVWLMLIVGFGGLGQTLRALRRRALA